MDACSFSRATHRLWKKNKSRPLTCIVPHEGLQFAPQDQPWTVDAGMIDPLWYCRACFGTKPAEISKSSLFFVEGMGFVITALDFSRSHVL